MPQQSDVECFAGLVSKFGRIRAESFQMYSAFVDAGQSGVLTHRVHHRCGATGIDMPSLRQGLQSTLNVGPAGVLVVRMDRDAIPERFELLKIGGIAPRPDAVEQTPGIAALDAPLDHAKDRRNPNATCDKNVARRPALETEERTWRSHFEGVSQAKVLMGIAGSAA